MSLSNATIVAIVSLVVAFLGVFIAIVVVLMARRRRHIRTIRAIELDRLNPTTLPPPILTAGGRQPGLVHQEPPRQHIHFARIQHPRQAAGGAPSPV
ncbi:hypothetical protein PTMSG1_05243 [Pyrenophora teres f. maculata]|nr:hypothetical protein PTMSG1_05243 [Pyrenophora teres f. maculata]